jgi:hypothetical protein
LFGCSAGPALAHIEALAHMHHGFAFPGRAYHFPSAISFKIALSSVRSAETKKRVAE